MPIAASIPPLSASPFRSESASGVARPEGIDGMGGLTVRLRNGDETAWTEVHREYAPRLFRYLLVVTGGREDLATEALQATWIRCVRHIRRFDSEETFWSWLTVLARSSVTDEHRRQNRFVSFLQRVFESRPAVPVLPPPDTDAELLSLLESGLQGLPAEERALLEGKYLQHQSPRDLAAEWEITEKAVESRLARGRLRVRETVLRHLRRESENES